MSDKPARARLCELNPDNLGRALEKAAKLRLHHESDVAESICRDILAVNPEHQEALICIVLCLSDQFQSGRATLEQARQFIPSLRGEYQRHYYLGVVCQRWARSLYHRSPDAVSLEWYLVAMREFDKASALSTPPNEEAKLRWNACFRLIRANESLQAQFDALWGVS